MVALNKDGLVKSKHLRDEVSTHNTSHYFLLRSCRQRTNVLGKDDKLTAEARLLSDDEFSSAEWQTTDHRNNGFILEKKPGKPHLTANQPRDFLFTLKWEITLEDPLHTDDTIGDHEPLQLMW